MDTSPAPPQTYGGYVTEPSYVGEPECATMDIPYPDVDKTKFKIFKRKSKEEEKVSKAKRKKIRNAEMMHEGSPRNATMALNDIAMAATGKPATFKVYASDIPGKPWCAEATYGDVVHKGYGTSSALAKQDACERHLETIIKNNMEKLKAPKKSGEENGSSEPEVSEIPWGPIFGFVMKKYLDSLTGVQPTPMMINPAQFFAPVAGGYPFQDFAAQPTPTSGSDIKPPHKQVPAKKLPDNAAQYHPAMLLSNMRPDVKLNLITDSQVPGETRFKVGTEIDGHKFEGFGPNLKIAKREAARVAVKALFGVECQEQ
ncbi:uncharacterized protein LOC136041579 isoform X2 [Artemia franciscana]|nr:hypothetical protein QYM36_017887 [Artemia franciscana]KAK2703754.1 hypothetical protein QYM36_017887 [Artemia franciscana]